MRLRPNHMGMPFDADSPPAASDCGRADHRARDGRLPAPDIAAPMKLGRGAAETLPHPLDPPRKPREVPRANLDDALSFRADWRCPAWARCAKPA